MPKITHLSKGFLSWSRKSENAHWEHCHRWEATCLLPGHCQECQKRWVTFWCFFNLILWNCLLVNNVCPRKQPKPCVAPPKNPLEHVIWKSELDYCQGHGKEWMSSLERKSSSISYNKSMMYRSPDSNYWLMLVWHLETLVMLDPSMLSSVQMYNWILSP